ncbi:MAG: response regulator [Specibacter sp.]
MTGKHTAVIIEDDQDIRELLTVIVRQSGYEVQAEATGAAGLEAVRGHRPALVTVDVGLPDIDGFEVIKRIRPMCQSYIIMLTARSREADTLTGLEAGADEYLTKPFRPQELRAKLVALAASQAPKGA